MSKIKRVISRFLHLICKRRRLLQWASTIDSSKDGSSHVVKDYNRLYKEKGLTREEYYEFEFEKRSEVFRKSFLGLNEQRYYLDYLNPVKYYSLARNKYRHGPCSLNRISTLSLLFSPRPRPQKQNLKRRSVQKQGEISSF